MESLDCIKTRLEKHFKDAMYIEFTIQENKLWILEACVMEEIGRKTGRASLKIALDLYREKIINENEAISKIQINGITEVSHPNLKNKDKLKLILKGCAVSPGIATGMISFSSQDIVNNRNNCILCKEEVSPEDIPAMKIAQATITTRGGMTSHAALCSRGLKKCCVTGIDNLRINSLQKIATTNDLILKEGDWITIDGDNGCIYLGKGLFENFNWRENEDLYLLHRIIEKVICTNTVNLNAIGKVWLLRDFFLHNIPVEIGTTNKKIVKKYEYISFKHPTTYTIKKYYKLLTEIPFGLEDIKLIIIGLRNTLLRQLVNKVGIGKHYKYYRPILDPMLCINYSDGKNTREQLIGEEFFDVGKYLPNYIDIYKIRIYTLVQIEGNDELSFLDYTNMKGESIVLNSSNIKKVYIEINKTAIDINELPNLYNIFRRREYFWTWYDDNLTTHKEMIDFLNKSQNERVKDFRMNIYAHELELLENNSLTNSGKALVL